MYPGNPKRNWGNVQNLSPHINPHTDYSQNYEILPNLHRSANPCLFQWLQTIEKEKSPYGSDIHLCLTNTTKTIAIFSSLRILWVDWVQLGGFLLHVESHLWLLSAGGSTRLEHPRKLIHMDEHWYWLLLGNQLGLLIGASCLSSRSLHA